MGTLWGGPISPHFVPAASGGSEGPPHPQGKLSPMSPGVTLGRGEPPHACVGGTVNKELCAHPAPSRSCSAMGVSQGPQTPPVPHPCPRHTYIPIYSPGQKQLSVLGGQRAPATRGARSGGAVGGPGGGRALQGSAGGARGRGTFSAVPRGAQGRLELLAVLFRFCRHRTALGTCSPDVTWKLPHHTMKAGSTGCENLALKVWSSCLVRAL